MKKKYLYYPGCTLKTKAKELDMYALKSLKILGIEVEEFEDWQCCGAVYPQTTDEIAARLSAVRVLELARRNGQNLLTLCSACHHVLKRVNSDMRLSRDIRQKVNNYCEFESPYGGETNVVHFFELLRDDITFEKLKKHVPKPITNKKIGAYYGCLLLRPGDTMQFDDPENPAIIEDFLKAIGAETIQYTYRNECCGAYTAIENEKLTQKLCGNIISSCKQKSIEALVTACPLCRYNLTKNAPAETLPVYYFTQLLAEALGVGSL